MKQAIYFFSGPCGCGKSTLADIYAKKLVEEGKYYGKGYGKSTAKSGGPH